MVNCTIDVASGDPGAPSLSGVVTWSVCPAVYKMYRCVYITLRPRERRALAWLPRMIYCAIWGLVHDLAVPPWPCQWCRPSTEIVTQRRTLYRTHTLFQFFKIRAYRALEPPSCIRGVYYYKCMNIDADTGKNLFIGRPSASHLFLFHVGWSGLTSWCFKWAVSYDLDMFEASPDNELEIPTSCHL